jgi:hypothetical protein
MAHFGPNQEKKYRRKAALEREVLEHLTLYSPKKWDTLYIHFAIDRQTNIQPVLHALKDTRYVEVSEDADQLVRITASGLKRLEKQDFLRGSA